MDWAPRVTVAAVIERDGSFLLVEETVDGRRVVNQPAGHLEDGESLPEAVTREVREETGLVFRPEAVVGIYLWRHPRGGETFLRTAFCGSAGGAATPADPDIVAVHWLTAAQLRDGPLPQRSPLVLRSVEDYLAGRRYPLGIIATL